MKTIKLSDGTTFRASKNMSDAEISRAVKKLIQKPDKKPQEIKLINVPEYPQFPEIPKPNDYTKELEKIADSLSRVDNSASLKHLSELSAAVAILGAKIDSQTEQLVKVMTMQADVMAELVLAYREPKKIVRDGQGRPDGIENVNN